MNPLEILALGLITISISLFLIVFWQLKHEKRIEEILKKIEKSK